MMKIGLLLTLFFCILVGCNLVGVREREFRSIKKGMTKSEVLDVAGSPHWSDRKRGRDRWFYNINPHDRETERIVYFENNKVVDTGKRPSPGAWEMEKMKTDSRRKPRKPGLSEKELRRLIKEEIQRDSRSKPRSFEKL